MSQSPEAIEFNFVYFAWSDNEVANERENGKKKKLSVHCHGTVGCGFYGSSDIAQTRQFFSSFCEMIRIVATA